jgi:dethiobiotin synthetase
MHADYWKPVQAGFDDGTDALLIKQLISNTNSTIHPELYKLKICSISTYCSKRRKCKN